MNKHQFIPDKSNIIYNTIYTNNVEGHDRVHLIKFIGNNKKKYKGIFIHSGNSLKIELSKEKLYKVKFRCLLQGASREKAEDQSFQIKSIDKNEVIFQYLSIKEQRNYSEESIFEIIANGCIELSTFSNISTSYGWNIFNVISCDEIDVKEEENEYQRFTFDLIDWCNLKCPACYHGIHGGTNNKMELDTAKKVLDHVITKFQVNEIYPYNWSEPLLNRELEQYIDLISKYDEITLNISSNMNPNINEDMLRNILPKIDRFKFSISGLDQEIYEKYHRGGNIKKVIENIDKVIKIKKEIGATTELGIVFGKNMMNKFQEEKLRAFCNERGMSLQPFKYYITDIQDVYRIYLNEQVDENIYNLLYSSYQEARQDIITHLTPNQCQLIRNDIVTDCQGKLMTCCGAKISLDVHITELNSIDEVVERRLENEFCSKCYKLGLPGYFRI